MTNFIVLGAIGGTEALLIIVALLLLFGGTKIPQLMRGLGEGIKEFKKASRDDDHKETPQDKPMAEGK